MVCAGPGVAPPGTYWLLAPAPPEAPKLPPAPPPPQPGCACPILQSAGSAPAPTAPARVDDASSVPEIVSVVAAINTSGREPEVGTVPVTSTTPPAITHSAGPLGWLIVTQRGSLSVLMAAVIATLPS